MIEIIMIIIKKTQKWESKAQSRFHVLQGLQIAVIFNLKISLSWSKSLTHFACKIWAKSVGLPVRSFSIWLHFYGLSLLIRPNQYLKKKFYQIARFRKNCSLHTLQGTCDWNLRIPLQKGQNYANCLTFFKCSLRKLLFNAFQTILSFPK